MTMELNLIFKIKFIKNNNYSNFNGFLKHDNRVAPVYLIKFNPNKFYKAKSFTFKTYKVNK